MHTLKGSLVKYNNRRSIFRHIYSYVKVVNITCLLYNLIQLYCTYVCTYLQLYVLHGKSLDKYGLCIVDPMSYIGVITNRYAALFVF